MFSRGGFDAKAIAIYKQILRTEEDSLEARTHLGECFQRMGLSSDALREFQEAFKICQKRELKREAFDLLRRVASLDPSNIANRLNLADLFAREKMEDDARREYTSLLEEVRRQTGTDLLLRVAEQMRRAFPDSREALDALAWGKIQTGAHAEAARLLKAALPNYPDDIPMRESLVSALEGMGDTGSARKIWREIAELHKTRGDVEKSREIMQRYGGLASFGGSEETTTPSILLTDQTARPAPTFDAPDADEDIDLELDEPAPSKPVSRAPIVEKTAPGARHRNTPAAAKPAFRAEPPAAKPMTSPSDLIAEARVALEFGDPAEASRLAKLVLEADPDSRDARKVLADVGRLSAKEGGDTGDEVLEIERSSLVEDAKPDRKAGGARAKAGIAPLAPSEEFDSLPDIEIVLEDEEDRDGKFASVEPPSGVHEGPPPDLAPRRPAPKAAAKVAAKPPQPVIEPPAAEEESFDIEVEIEDEPAADLDLDVGGDDSLEFSEPLASDRPEVGSFAASSARIEESLSEADFYLEQGLLEEAERLYQAVLKTVPAHPKAQLRMGEIEARRATLTTGGAKPKRAAKPAKISDPLGDTMVREPNGDDALSIPDMPDELVAKPPREKPAASKPTPVLAKPVPKLAAKPERIVVAEDTAPPFDLEPEPPEDLAAAEDSGAPEAEFHPSELTAEFDEAEAEAAAAEAHDEEDAFDLAAELDEDDDTSGGTIGTLVGVGALGKGFVDVFSAFKKGIQQHVDEGDADTHYDLAIAYKEMGLNEDAVRELETVLRTGTRAIEALSLMAACKLALGDAEAAGAHLEDALERAGDSDESSVSLRYDLAEALLAAGRETEALEAFQKVSAVDPDFRDVAERISRFS